jgi:hypothetical protein
VCERVCVCVWVCVRLVPSQLTVASLMPHLLLLFQGSDELRYRERRGLSAVRVDESGNTLTHTHTERGTHAYIHKERNKVDGIAADSCC